MELLFPKLNAMIVAIRLTARGDEAWWCSKAKSIYSLTREVGANKQSGSRRVDRGQGVVTR